MPEDTIKADEFNDYDFGGTAAPEGFNPEARGIVDPPPGEHVMRVDTFEVKQNNVFKSKNHDDCTAHQLRPILVVVGGNHEGKQKMDFLPLPTPGITLPTHLANRWANFITAFGFKPPANAIVPPNFTLHKLIGAKAKVILVEDEWDGKKQIKVKYFGYEPLTGSASAFSTKKSAEAKPEAKSDLNLDEL